MQQPTKGDPLVRVTQYTVNYLPDTVPDADIFAITIEARGTKWGIYRGPHRSLGADGAWSWGYRWLAPDGAERYTSAEWDDYHAGQDRWLAEHRHALETALALAKRAAPRVSVNGWTAEAALAQHVKDGAE